MQKIIISHFGGIKTDFIKLARAEYQKRLQAFCDLKLNFFEAVKNKTPQETIEKEGKIFEEYLHKNKSDQILIALNIEGQSFSSEALAQKIASYQLQSKTLHFVIGGAFGLSEKIKKQADLQLSFSKMTFTHEMISILLLEQLYRAFCINNNKNYHY